MRLSWGEFVTAPLLWLAVIGIVGMIVWKLIGPRRSNLRLVVQIAFFAAMTSIIIFRNVPLSQAGDAGFNNASTILIAFAQILWWLHLSWAVIGFVRIFLVLEGRPREARLLQDIVVGAVYTFASLSALAFVFGVPVGTLIATSGVIAIAFGLALQNTLGDVFSGIALTLGRAFTLGDWIRLSDGVEGRVIASTWRSTQILTVAHNIVVLPNSALAKLGLTNLSRPSEAHLLQLNLRIKPTRLPSFIEDVLNTALCGCNFIIKDPQPVVALKGLDSAAVDVDLFFRVKDPSNIIKARNELIDLIMRHCKAAGLVFAPPSSVIIANVASSNTENEQSIDARVHITVKQSPIFAELPEEDKEKLVRAGSIKHYREGDEIVQQGQELFSVIIICAGVVKALQNGEELWRLSPGDFFGRIELQENDGIDFSISALTSVTVFEADRAHLEKIFTAKPSVAREIASKLSRQPNSNKQSSLAEINNDINPHSVLKAIRTIFTH
ncbi:mechanosensitive ion channel family protein [Brucella cytisi]|uniref:Small-conductance mechanosensitive channel n=1 Tax=Brucella cytisi TaxID=407152 RepID=A0A1J6HPK5_9HYPH|nr:mechanosensitive ion channel family protein [Brucella cytisi]OIS94868.1 small mechanosensitive ion channel [Brucella cytisi]